MKTPVRPWQRRASLPPQKFERRQMAPLQQFMQMRRMGRQSTSKIVITDETAMRIGAVYASVRVLSGLASTLPCEVFERKGTGIKDVKVHEHPLAQLLQVAPNSWQVPAIFEEQREAALRMWGNAYTELFVDPVNGDVNSFLNHHPYNVTPYFDQGRLKYRIQTDEGTIVRDASYMVHVPNFGFNGLEGLSTVALAGDAFGIAASADKLAATFNGNAAKPFLIVSSPEYLEDGPFDRLNRQINDEYKLEDAFGSMLLEGGMTADTLSMPLKDAQFLESRKFQGEEITSRWFGLPPHLAGYLDNAHYDNLEEQDRSLLVYTLGPILVRKEQIWNTKGFRRGERGKYYVKYNVDEVLRGQMKERYESHRSSIQAGWKTVNEVREIEDYPPLPGGDVLPRPAAIWGKPDGEDESTTPRKAPEPRSNDPRLSGLVLDVLNGLQQAEKIHAERAATKPDAELRIREWYESHERRALDKLRSLNPDAGRLLDHYREHRNQLLTAVRDASPAAAVEACLSGWRDDAARLAGELVT